MGRPEFTAPPEAYTDRKFARNVLLATPGSVSLGYIDYGLDSIVGALSGLLLFVLLVSAAWYVGQLRTG